MNKKEEVIREEKFDSNKSNFYQTTIEIKIKFKHHSITGVCYHLTRILTLQGKIQREIKISHAKKIAQPFLKKYIEKNIMDLKKSQMSILFKKNKKSLEDPNYKNKKKLYITQTRCYIQ